MRIRPLSGMAIAGAAALAVTGGSACAMNNTAGETIRCSVIGAEKLPSEVGGADAVCSALAAAAVPAARSAGISESALSVTVTVSSPSVATAVATVGTVALPEQTVGVSDRDLSKSAIEMLARALASQISSTRE